MSKCKNCKHCQELQSQMTIAFGGNIFVCDISNQTIGHRYFGKKEKHLYTEGCEHYEARYL